MVPSKNTLKTKIAVSVFGLLVISCSLTSCQTVEEYTEAELRPGRLLVDPDVWKQETDQQTIGDAMGTDSPIASPPGQSHNSNLVISADKFEDLQEDTIACEDYSTYLDEKITKPLNELAQSVTYENAIAAETSGSYGKVYMNVTHVGYNYDETTQKMSQGSRYNRTFQQSMSYCGGYAMSLFAKQMLEELSINSEVFKVATSQTSSKIESSGLGEDTSWIVANSNVTENKSPKLDIAILSIWGQETFEEKTLEEFYTIVKSGNFQAIPNINYKWYSSATSPETFKLNDTSTSKGYHYLPSISITNINKLCCAFNPFTTRSIEVLDDFYTDDQSLLRVYVDGYTKTIIYLATEPGFNLKEVMGVDRYNQALDIISNANSPVETLDILKEYPDATVIPSGTKGVD